jgi:hypothetical protein
LAPAQTRQDRPSQQPAAASQQASPQGRAHEEKGPRAGDRKETTGASRDQSSQNEPSRAGGSEKSSDKAAGSDRNTSGATGADSKPNAADSAQEKDSKKGTTQRSDRQKGAKSNRSSATGAKQETGGNAQRQDTATERKTNDAKTNDVKTNSPAQKSDRSTAGQSPSNTRSNANSNNTSNQSDPRQPSSGSSSQTNSQSGNRTGSQQSTIGANGRTGSTTASVEQQTKFNEVIRRQNIRSVTNVNFSVSVGTAIPTSVHVYDVPREIVTIYPEYRGKKFVVVRDEIVIIEPGTRKIVAVMPRSGRTTTGTTTSTTTKSSRLNLAPEKRRMIRETVIKEQSAPRCSDVTVTVGETVSSSLRLDPLPSLVVQDVPEVRSYEFCIKDNDVVLVDPGEHRIIDVID